VIGRLSYFLNQLTNKLINQQTIYQVLCIIKLNDKIILDF